MTENPIASVHWHSYVLTSGPAMGNLIGFCHNRSNLSLKPQRQFAKIVEICEIIFVQAIGFFCLVPYVAREPTPGTRTNGAAAEKLLALAQ